MATNKKVIYTVITGGYDGLIEQPQVKGYDFVCFTDNTDLKSETWQIKPLPEGLEGLTKAKQQRNVKILAHKYLPEYDFSIYIDGNVKIVGDINKFVKENCSKTKGYIFIGKHPSRDCIYEEAKACIYSNKDDSHLMTDQVIAYHKEGMPLHYGLTQNCIILRYHNNDNCKRLMELWWNEVKEKSHRDQLSLYYCLWKDRQSGNNTDITVLDKSIFHGDTFSWGVGHQLKKNSVEVKTSGNVEKKILFLVQSCNEERYLNEEQIIRETWSKRLRKNCDLVFYRGDGDNTFEGDVLKIDCNDTLNGTFLKTLKALAVFRNKNYDFIVRVNTSNWINVDLLLDTLETFDTNKRELYGCDVVSNVGSQGIPFLRGNILVINRQLMKDIFEMIKLKCVVGVDDVCFALNLLKYYQTINVDYMGVLKTLGSVLYTEDYDFNDLEKTLVVRCAIYIKDTGNSDIIREIDKKYINSRSIQPKKAEYVETVLGKIKIA